MRIIPVIDLQAGRVVHAVRGERSRYQPLRSVICASAAPVDVARALRDTFGFSEIYVADLDAIQASGGHRTVIADLVRRVGMQVLLDAGAAEVGAIRAWLELGVTRVVVGAETLPDLRLLETLPASDLGSRLIFSLDMRAGRVLSACAELAALAPIQVVERLVSAGWREVLLLDLARVGSGAGTDASLIRAVRRAFPQIALTVGGGIRNVEELAALEAAGVSAALLATALHSGAITRTQLAALAGLSG